MVTSWRQWCILVLAGGHCSLGPVLKGSREHYSLGPVLNGTLVPDQSAPGTNCRGRMIHFLAVPVFTGIAIFLRFNELWMPLAREEKITPLASFGNFV